jgi:nucleotide-binding universal stress UspA family protein
VHIPVRKQAKRSERILSYKTILVHVEESGNAGERIKLAAAVAMAERAHLIGIATTGASRYIHRNRILAELDPNFQTHLDFLRQRANRGLAKFDAAVQRLGLDSVEKHLVDDEAGGGVCLQARYCDLVVIGQHNPNDLASVVLPDFPQYVVINSGRPVLIVPHAGRFDTIGQHVMIAWDASMPAAHAVTGALPLLRRAQRVTVALIDAAPAAADAPPPGSELCQYLQRHGVKASLLQRAAGVQGIGAALLALTSECASDLMVMGCHGHLRFREIMLGGVSSDVLRAMAVPVLMAA